MEIVKDLIYKHEEDSDSKSKKCDVYFPSCSSTEKRPVVILVHGGAWCLGGKEEMRETCTYLVNEKHCVCVAISYTLSEIDKDIFQKLILCELLCLVLALLFTQSGKFKIVLLFVSFFIAVYAILKMSPIHQSKSRTHPMHVQDVAKSIQFVYENIHKYGNGDGKNIFLLGHSAGAHLVALVTLNRRFLNKLDVPIEIIRGVVAISGPYSFWKIQQSSVKYLISKSVFGDHSSNFNEDQLNLLQYDELNAETKDKWAKIVDAWPSFHEHSIDKYTPPFLLLTAGIDMSLLYHAKDFKNMLSKNNVHVQHVHFDNTNHFSIKTKWNNKHKHIGETVSSFIKTIFIYS